MSYAPSGEVSRNPRRFEWEALVGEGTFFHVGHGVPSRQLDGKAGGVVLFNAAEVARDHEQPVRLYVSHPSPGPTRRFCGEVRPDGMFVDARR